MTREQTFIHFFSHLSVESLNEISNIFATNARFKDPFNDVTGVSDIKKIFTHMFETTDQPVFVVNHHANNEDKLFIQWRFSFIKNNKPWSINGSSMITFNQHDQVIEHIDYWDPAEQIYSKISLFKPLFNFLRSKLSAN